MKNVRSILLTTLAAAAFVAVPGAGHAQSAVGIVGGVNFANVGGDDAEDTERRTGFQIGGFASVPLGQVLTFRPEVVYTQKGARGDFLGLDRELKVDYLEVPVLLRIGVPGVGYGLHALVGPTLSFELSCDVDVSVGGSSGEAACDDVAALNDNDRKNFVVGGQVGAGVDLPMSAFTLGLDGRYTFDLESFVDEDVADVSHRVWSITASLGFPLG